MKAAKQAKAPLVHSEALVWLHACVKDFGAGVLPAPQLVAFAVAELEHVNPKVPNSCIIRFLQCSVGNASFLPDTCVCHLCVVIGCIACRRRGGRNNYIPVELHFRVSSKGFVAVTSFTSYEVRGIWYRICFGLL